MDLIIRDIMTQGKFHGLVAQMPIPVIKIMDVLDEIVSVKDSEGRLASARFSLAHTIINAALQRYCVTFEQAVIEAREFRDSCGVGLELNELANISLAEHFDRDRWDKERF